MEKYNPNGEVVLISHVLNGSECKFRLLATIEQCVCVCVWCVRKVALIKKKRGKAIFSLELHGHRGSTKRAE